MTDGQIYFDSALFYKGIKPAIDFGLSVSRIGNKAQWPAVRKISKDVRLEYLQYQELLQMTQLRTTGLSKEAAAKLKRGEAINQLIIQDKNKPVSIEEQIVYLQALNNGMLDGLSVAEIKQFRADICPLIEKRNMKFFPNLRETKELDERTKEELNRYLDEYFKGGKG